MIDDETEEEQLEDPPPFHPVEPPPPAVIQPRKGSHIFVDGGATGSYELMDAPADYDNDRKLTLPGIGNVEHVDTHPSGVWMYRRM